MFWRVLPHATACVASGKLILLDVRQDRYFLAPAAVAEVMERWLRSGGGLQVPAAVIRLFRQSGIARTAEQALMTADRERLEIPRTLASAEHISCPSPLPDATRVAAIVGVTWLELRLRPLQAILTRRTRRDLPKASARVERLIAGSAAYDSARKFSPFARNCLLDSLALDTWLGRGSGDRQLVFGVTGQPFAAHCWLQTGQAILNDSYERVSRYTPILAI